MPSIHQCHPGHKVDYLRQNSSRRLGQVPKRSINRLNAPTASSLQSFSVFLLDMMGFIFLDTSEVRCSTCGCTYTIAEMEQYDDRYLNRRHEECNPNCPVLQKVISQYNGQLRNPGAPAPMYANLKSSQKSATNCRTHSHYELPSVTTESQRDIISDSIPGKVFSGNGPSKPNYSQYRNRLATYDQQWYSRSKKNSRPAPEELAASGFYSYPKERKDAAKCYACDVVMYDWSDWSDKEDVWVKHAQQSPTCDHVKRHKGEDFITRVVEELANSEVKDPTKRAPVTKEGAMSIGISQTWIKTITEMGFSLDDLVLVYLYKKSQHPEKPIVFADIQEPVNMILFEKDEAESNFPKFESQWPNGQNLAPVTTVQSSVTPAVEMQRDEDDVETDGELELPGEETQCKICFSKKADVLLRPCSHMVSCESCTSRLKNCPICRNPIQGIMLVDF